MRAVVADYGDLSPQVETQVPPLEVGHNSVRAKPEGEPTSIEPGSSFLSQSQPTPACAPGLKVRGASGSNTAARLVAKTD